MADSDDNLSGGIQPMFDDPNLPKGWSRDVVQRKAGGRYEVSIISDTGKTLKTRVELANYLKDHKIKMKAEEFDFTVMGKNYVPQRSSRTRAVAKPPQTPKPESKGKKVADKKDAKHSANEKKINTPKTKTQAKPPVTSTRKRRGVKEDDEPAELPKGRKTRVKEEPTDEESTEEKEDTQEQKSDDVKTLPKRGRVKPKRYDSPEPEPAPRRAKMKALFKDIDDSPEPKQEPETPSSKGRGRPKKVVESDEKEDKKPPASASTGKGKKTGAKKAKPKKNVQDPDDPDAAKNSQILAEIEAELAEINGTKSRRRGPKKRRGSSTNTTATPTLQPKPSEEAIDKDRPALEGFEAAEIPQKRQRAEDSKSSDKGLAFEGKEEPTEPTEAPQPETSDTGRRRSQRSSRSKINIPALLTPEYESPEEEEEEEEPTPKPPPPRKPKKITSPKPKVKSEKKKAKTTKRRRASKAVSEEEDESIPLDSLEGAINSAASLLQDDGSDSSGEQEVPVEAAAKPTQPKQSRSGRNVRSPRRPMEADFETDFSTLRRAMNATTSDFASRRRKMQQAAEMRYDQRFDPRYEQQSYDQQIAYDYLATANAFRRTSETARTRTYDENKMEKTLSLMDPNIVSAAQDSREPLLLETHLRAAEPPGTFPPKRQRKSSSQSDMRTPGDNKVFYRKFKPGSSKQHTTDRSLLKNMRIDTSAEGDHMESLLAQQQSPSTSRILSGRDPKDLISEMTPPPTQPIIPSDDHNYSMSSKYLGESASSHYTAAAGDHHVHSDGMVGSGGVETRVLSVDQHELLHEISSASSSAQPALQPHGDGGVTVPITSVGAALDGESGAAPKEIVIYVGDKPTVVPVMQDESGMSVITLPNGIAEEDIQASLEAAAN